MAFVTKQQADRAVLQFGGEGPERFVRDNHDYHGKSEIGLTRVEETYQVVLRSAL